MVVRKVRFNSWEELKAAILKYEQMGYSCEVRGWDDISGNVLSLIIDD